MTITSTDIQIRYSGGVFNTDPMQSTGGLMSGTIIVNGTLDNLFESNPTLQTGQDFVDCRALYVLNTNENSNFSNVTVACNHNPATGTDIALWVPLRNERQQIVFQNFNAIQSGSFSLKNGTAYLAAATNPIPWSSNISTLATNIQSALSAIFETTVTGSLLDNVATFVVEFIHGDGHKLHPILTVPHSTLTTPAGLVDIGIGPVLSPINLPRQIDQSPLIVMVPQRGTPINDVAENLEFSNNLPVEADGNWFPGNVWSASDSPISIGTLKPGESFFIWIKRTIPSAAVLSNGLLPTDQLILTITGS